MAYDFYLAAERMSKIAFLCYYPSFITQDFCDQHKRRLYTKDPIHYAQFAEYGTSDENWYVVDGVLRKYVNSKWINK